MADNFRRPVRLVSQPPRVGLPAIECVHVLGYARADFGLSNALIRAAPVRAAALFLSGRPRFRADAVWSLRIQDPYKIRASVSSNFPAVEGNAGFVTSLHMSVMKLEPSGHPAYRFAGYATR